MVVKSKEKTSNGEYITEGVNWYNPLSYIVVFIASLVVGIVGFFDAFIETWKDSIN